MKPNIESAAIVANVVARLLKKAGCQMADKSNRHRWTEGLHAYRIGVSSTVAVDYHFRDVNAQNLELRRAKRAEASQLLEAKGYALDPAYPDLVYITCKGP
jgi:hypothetical protein